MLASLLLPVSAVQFMKFWLFLTLQKEAAASAVSTASVSGSRMMRKLMPGGTEVPLNPPTSCHGSSEGFSEGELMRALARRPERVGSKLLKEKYGTPIAKPK